MFYNLLFESVKDSDQFSAQLIFARVKDRVDADGVLQGNTLRILSPEDYRAWITP